MLIENNVNNLDEAKKEKMDLICSKIGLKNSQTVLDIGGYYREFFVEYAAKKYAAKVAGTTVAKEQISLA